MGIRVWGPYRHRGIYIYIYIYTIPQDFLFLSLKAEQSLCGMNRCMLWDRLLYRSAFKVRKDNLLVYFIRINSLYVFYFIVYHTVVFTLLIGELRIHVFVTWSQISVAFALSWITPKRIFWYFSWHNKEACISPLEFIEML